jgi:hypothetical protein
MSRKKKPLARRHVFLLKAGHGKDAQCYLVTSSFFKGFLGRRRDVNARRGDVQAMADDVLRTFVVCTEDRSIDWGFPAPIEDVEVTSEGRRYDLHPVLLFIHRTETVKVGKECVRLDDHALAPILLKTVMQTVPIMIPA